MSSVTALRTPWRHLIIYRVPDGLHYDYINSSALDHLRNFGRLTLYYYKTRRSYFRHHSNIFVVPEFINNLPMNKRLYFVDNFIQLLHTVPPHKPLHLDLNDYPELFI